MDNPTQEEMNAAAAMLGLNNIRNRNRNNRQAATSGNSLGTSFSTHGTPGPEGAENEPACV